MANPIEIQRYTYHVFSSRDENEVVMYLYDHRANLVAKVFFVSDAGTLPPARAVDGKYVLYYRRSRLSDVVDLLRNEGPIYLIWDGAADTTLSTEYEPVGEGERMTAHR